MAASFELEKRLPKVKSDPVAELPIYNFKVCAPYSAS